MEHLTQVLAGGLWWLLQPGQTVAGKGSLDPGGEKGTFERFLGDRLNKTLLRDQEAPPTPSCPAQLLGDTGRGSFQGQDGGSAGGTGSSRKGRGGLAGAQKEEMRQRKQGWGEKEVLSCIRPPEAVCPHISEGNKGRPGRHRVFVKSTGSRSKRKTCFSLALSDISGERGERAGCESVCGPGWGKVLRLDRHLLSVLVLGVPAWRWDPNP